jgi:hypothetical protein
MARAAGRLMVLAVVAALAAGCGGGGKKLPAVMVSGKVTFKGQPVPAGFITFQAEQGPVRSAEIKDGVYDTAKSADPGVIPGTAVVRITGFDGKKLPYYPQGKQIFNPYELRETITEGATTKDFDVPASAANNLKIEPTADVP